MNPANYTVPPQYATDIVQRLLEVVQALDVCEANARDKSEIFVPVTQDGGRLLAQVFQRAIDAKFLGNASGLVNVSAVQNNMLKVYPAFDDSLRNVDTPDGKVDVIAKVKGQLESLIREPDLELIKTLVPENQARAYANKPMVDYSRMPVESRYVFDSIMSDISAAIKPMKSPIEKLGNDTVGHVAEVTDESASVEQSVKIPMPDKETARAVKWLLEECRNTLGSTTFRESFSVDNKANYVTLRAKGAKSLGDVLEVFEGIEERTLTRGLNAIDKGDMQKHFAKTVYNMPESAANIGGGISAA